MKAKIKQVPYTLGSGTDKEKTINQWRLTWTAPSKTITTFHNSLEEVYNEMRKHQSNKELYELEDQAISEWYEENRKNGSNWTGD